MRRPSLKDSNFPSLDGRGRNLAEVLGEGEKKFMKRKLTPTARSLRKRMTDAEIKLWKHLSRKQLGVIFRRQYPIGKYIVDFVSFDVKLVVEVDGSQHAESKTDRLRDEWFASQGFKVLRFWNNDVLRNIEGAIKVISNAVSPSLMERDN